MKKATFIFSLLLFFSSVIFAQYDNLSSSAYKKKGHFVGKAYHNAYNDRFMGKYEIVFDFWSLFGDPCFEFKFKWNLAENYVGLLNEEIHLGNAHSSHKINDERYLRSMKIYDQMKKKITPLTDLDDNKLLTVRLEIGIYNKNALLKTVFHDAKIDLPTVAGKWNTFSLPSTGEWSKVFVSEGSQNFVSENMKEAYKKEILGYLKKADHLEVKIRQIDNIRWDVKEYDDQIKKLKEEQQAEDKANKNQPKKQSDDDFWNTAKSVKSSTNDDDFWNSGGQSKAEKAASSIERADNVFNQILGYKDKSNLNEARRLYQQALANNPNCDYAKSQLAKVERLLNFKPFDIDADGRYQCTKGCGYTFWFEGDEIHDNQGNVHSFLDANIVKKGNTISAYLPIHGGETITFNITNNGVILTGPSHIIKIR